MSTRNVRVAVYGKPNIDRILITFYDGADKKFCGGYVKVWGKGSRLYFLMSTEGNAVRLGENHTLSFSKRTIIEAIKEFEGEYLLQHDSNSGYYIDKTMKIDVNAFKHSDPIEVPEVEEIPVEPDRKESDQIKIICKSWMKRLIDEERFEKINKIADLMKLVDEVG